MASNVCLLILIVVMYCVLLLMFSCMWCDTLLGMQYDVLLVFIGAVYLRLYIPWIAMCWSQGAVQLGWYPGCRLKHNWSIHVVCGGWV